MGRRQAISEVASKSDADIERETADKWAWRAVACYVKYDEFGDDSWIVRGDNYRHEALEHASLVGDRGNTVRRVQDMIDGEVRKLGSDTMRAVKSMRRTQSNRRRQ